MLDLLLGLVFLGILVLSFYRNRARTAGDKAKEKTVVRMMAGGLILVTALLITKLVINYS